MGWVHKITPLRHGDGWQYHMRIAHQIFRKEDVKNYHDVLLEEAPQELGEIQSMQWDVCNPEYPLSYLLIIMLQVICPNSDESMNISNVESIDGPLPSPDDQSVTLGLEFLVPNTTLINIFPILAFIQTWFPFTSSFRG